MRLKIFQGKNCCPILIMLILFSTAACTPSGSMDSVITADKTIIRACRIKRQETNAMLKNLEMKELILQAKVKSAYKNSKAVKAATDTAVVHIFELKYQLIHSLSGMPFDEIDKLDEGKYHRSESILSSLKDIGNTEVTEEVLFGNDDNKIDFLKQRLDEYKQKITEIVGAENAEKLHFAVVPDESVFKGESVAAVILMLNSIMFEVLNTEAETIALLTNQIDATNIAFDRIQPVVVAKNNHVKAGEMYEAEVYIVGYDTLQSHAIKIGNAINMEMLEVTGQVQNVKESDGSGKIRIKASGSGQKKLFGVLEVISRNNITYKYPFEHTYFVEP